MQEGDRGIEPRIGRLHRECSLRGSPGLCVVRLRVNKECVQQAFGYRRRGARRYERRPRIADENGRSPVDRREPERVELPASLTQCFAEISLRRVEPPGEVEGNLVFGGKHVRHHGATP